MGLSVIDKYVEKKKKDILEYSKILESLIALEDNKMWNNKTEFSVYSKEIISLYADTYYFLNNIHRDNPIEYLNDNINNVLKSIIEYYRKISKESMLKELKSETFLLSVIISTACYLDIATNVIDGNFVDTKNKFKYLLTYLKKTKILKVYSQDRVRINDLFSAIKKNVKEDGKFFEYYKSDTYGNEFIKYSKNPVYYLVNFKYTVPGLEEFDESLVKKVKESYNAKLLSMSYDLLIIYILKELISNKDVANHLIVLDKTLNKKITLLKEFDNKYLKDYVKVLVPFEHMADYLEAINYIEKLGIKIVYEYSGVENVKENKFERGTEIIVTDEFLRNNAENEYLWKQSGVKFVIRNKED